jgi:hypothetical protein
MLNDHDQRLSRECRSSTSLHGVCDRCGTVPTVLHLPLRFHGWYCPAHCPSCNRPGGAPTVPSAPTVITAGKFAGSLIGSLSLDDLREALRGTPQQDGAMRVAIAAERRRRWSSARRQRLLVRRQRDAQRRGGVI